MSLVAERSTGIHVLSSSRGRVLADAGVELAFGFWPGRHPPIIAIHGITASHAQFVGLAERLAGRRALLAIDLRGRGDSDKPDAGYGMQQHARDVAVVIQRFGLGPSLIVGHSMGAYVGAALAAEFPQLVSGLVLFDGGLPPDLPPNVPVAALLDQLLAPSLGRLRATFASREAYFDYWRAQPTFPPDAWNAWTEAYFDYDLGGEPPVMRAKALEASVRADWVSMADREAALARLRAVRAPALILRAEFGMAPGQPPILPESLVQTMREAIPGVPVVSLPGTTHYTCVLAEPGLSQAADLIVEFAERTPAC